MTSVRQNGKPKRRNKDMERAAENVLILSERMSVLSPKKAVPIKDSVFYKTLLK